MERFARFYTKREAPTKLCKFLWNLAEYRPISQVVRFSNFLITGEKIAWTSSSWRSLSDLQQLEIWHPSIFCRGHNLGVAMVASQTGHFYDQASWQGDLANSVAFWSLLHSQAWCYLTVSGSLLCLYIVSIADGWRFPGLSWHSDGERNQAFWGASWVWSNTLTRIKQYTNHTGLVDGGSCSLA